MTYYYFKTLDILSAPTSYASFQTFQEQHLISTAVSFTLLYMYCILCFDFFLKSVEVLVAIVLNRFSSITMLLAREFYFGLRVYMARVGTYL